MELVDIKKAGMEFRGPIFVFIGDPNEERSHERIRQVVWPVNSTGIGAYFELRISHLNAGQEHLIARDLHRFFLLRLFKESDPKWSLTVPYYARAPIPGVVSAIAPFLDGQISGPGRYIAKLVSQTGIITESDLIVCDDLREELHSLND